MQAIGGAIQSAQQEGMSEEDVDELLFSLNSAFKDILNFKKHLLRAFAQNVYWDRLVSEQDKTKAYLCQDWAMKWIGESFRESLKDFFGKAGMYSIEKDKAWFFFCFRF